MLLKNLKGYPLALFDEQHQSEENRQKSHAVKRQAHIDEKHEAQCDHYIEKVRNQIDEPIAQQVAQRIDIIDYADQILPWGRLSK